VADEEAALPEYKEAVLHPEIKSKELHQHTIGKLAGWIETIVRVESPVHVDEVAPPYGGSRRHQPHWFPHPANQLELAVRFAEGDGRVVRRANFCGCR
jgi:hypothetical protein